MKNKTLKLDTQKTQPNLTDVPETMLWTLHNRANEALRKDAIITDPKCIDIYQQIAYDYEKSFGVADVSHACRSVIFDKAIAVFLAKHPNATIINLGEGLETQRFRFEHHVNAQQSQWFSVDVPEAINIRERFITPDKKHQHIACSATETSWLYQIDKEKPVFISAQGLFMYFEEIEVKQLIKKICDYFEEGELMFDVIPRWLSKKTCSATGWQKTKHYTTPRMPWGINRNEAIPTIKSYSTNIISIKEVPFNFPRGVWQWLAPIFKKIPVLKNQIPSIYKVHFESISKKL